LYGHVLRKDDDWVKKCMEYEVEGPRPRGIMIIIIKRFVYRRKVVTSEDQRGPGERLSKRSVKYVN